MSTLQQRLIELNEQQSYRYTADESARRRYWAKHPTFFGCIKCMDGRVNFPLMTQTPMGLVKPFRAIGGKFQVWWPSFLGRMRHWVEKAMSIGSRNCVFVSYHYSASDHHLGCAGWKYDTESARKHAETLQQDLAFVFGDQMDAVTAGVETDRDILILHGQNGDVSGEMLVGKTEEDAREMMRKAFPIMHEQTIEDLIPLLMGNARRVAELTKQPRDLKHKDHNEQVIAVGQGFDWLAEENMALIINDADPNLAESIRVAGSLVQKNLAKMPGKDATLITSVTYHEPGLDYRQAVGRARGLLAFAKQVLRESQPDLFTSEKMHFIAAVTWEPNKKMEIVEKG